MLGLVIAGNMAMVFVFWELVGICSYFLIGFYIERKSASNAANKAFIVNRVGDFGMIIGLMAVWASLGTFAFGDIDATPTATVREPGIFSQVRPAENDHALVVPDGMVKLAAAERRDRRRRRADAASGSQPGAPRSSRGGVGQGYGYWLLVVAGLGIFCGCVGKSAQFPLHVWLPDAMEGPTPVSALIHAATMVAAGVYLVGRFYPVFTPEVLLVIAYHRLHHAVHRGHDRHHGHRHQARAGLFDRQPAGLHDAGPGRGRLAGRHVPPVHARLLQEPAVPLLRLGDPRLRTPTRCRRWAGCGRRCRGPPTRCWSAAWRSAGAGIPFVDRPERLLLEGLRSSPRRCRSGTPIRGSAGCSTWPRPAARRSRPSTCSACGS